MLATAWADPRASLNEHREAVTNYRLLARAIKSPEKPKPAANTVKPPPPKTNTLPPSKPSPVPAKAQALPESINTKNNPPPKKPEAPAKQNQKPLFKAPEIRQPPVAKPNNAPKRLSPPPQKAPETKKAAAPRPSAAPNRVAPPSSKTANIKIPVNPVKHDEAKQNPKNPSKPASLPKAGSPAKQNAPKQNTARPSKPTDAQSGSRNSPKATTLKEVSPPVKHNLPKQNPAKSTKALHNPSADTRRRPDPPKQNREPSNPPRTATSKAPTQLPKLTSSRQDSKSSTKASDARKNPSQAKPSIQPKRTPQRPPRQNVNRQSKPANARKNLTPATSGVQSKKLQQNLFDGANVKQSSPPQESTVAAAKDLSRPRRNGSSQKKTDSVKSESPKLATQSRTKTTNVKNSPATRNSNFSQRKNSSSTNSNRPPTRTLGISQLSASPRRNLDATKPNSNEQKPSDSVVKDAVLGKAPKPIKSNPPVKQPPKSPKTPQNTVKSSAVKTESNARQYPRPSNFGRPQASAARKDLNQALSTSRNAGTNKDPQAAHGAKLPFKNNPATTNRSGLLVKTNAKELPTSSRSLNTSKSITDKSKGSAGSCSLKGRLGRRQNPFDNCEEYNGNKRQPAKDQSGAPGLVQGNENRWFGAKKLTYTDNKHHERLFKGDGSINHDVVNEMGLKFTSAQIEHYENMKKEDRPYRQPPGALGVMIEKDAAGEGKHGIRLATTMRLRKDQKADDPKVPKELENVVKLGKRPKPKPNGADQQGTSQTPPQGQRPLVGSDMQGNSSTPYQPEPRPSTSSSDAKKSQTPTGLHVEGVNGAARVQDNPGTSPFQGTYNAVWRTQKKTDGWDTTPLEACPNCNSMLRQDGGTDMHRGQSRFEFKATGQATTQQQQSEQSTSPKKRKGDTVTQGNKQIPVINPAPINNPVLSSSPSSQPNPTRNQPPPLRISERPQLDRTAKTTAANNLNKIALDRSNSQDSQESSSSKVSDYKMDMSPRKRSVVLNPAMT